MKTYLYLLTVLVFAFSCQQTDKTIEVGDSKRPKSVNRDSLIKALYQYAESYFTINSLDSIVTIKGRPKYIGSVPWGEHVADSMLVVRYDFLEFNFWKNNNSKPELASIDLFDKAVILPGNLSIGKTTRQDILQSIGLPDSDHNDPGRSMTIDGDTTVYGTQSGAGDTVTFTYYINIDEYGIGLAMTKDTLRNVSWSKNPN